MVRQGRLSASRIPALCLYKGKKSLTYRQKFHGQQAHRGFEGGEKAGEGSVGAP